jgi:hypothetical protein
MRTQSIDVKYPPAALGSSSPQRIRWGAVFGGAILGIAFLGLLTALWLTLAYASGVDVVLDNLAWFIGGSAIACLFVAGLVAGWLSGVHGSGSGFFNGITIWALMLLLTIGVGVPATLNVLNLGRVTALDTATGNLLATAEDREERRPQDQVLGGLVASGLGGAIGGALARPANAELMSAAGPRTEVIERPDRPDLEKRTVVVPESSSRDDEKVRDRQRVP